jgi:hypothetical protein
LVESAGKMDTKLEIISRKKENFCSENFLDFQSADGEENLIFLLKLRLEFCVGNMLL